MVCEFCDFALTSASGARLVSTLKYEKSKALADFTGTLTPEIIQAKRSPMLVSLDKYRYFARPILELPRSRSCNCVEISLVLLDYLSCGNVRRWLLNGKPGANPQN